MTFSIVARAEDGSSWGVAVASKFLAVGNAVPAAVAGIGALATQADANVSWKGAGLSLLDEGASASEALEQLLAEDDKPEHRQIGIVDLQGRSASHTGSECMDWAGSYSAPNVAIQGNILAGADVLAAMRASWESSSHESVGHRPLAHRLLNALASGDAAGGDKRGRQSAALLVVSNGAGYGGLDDIVADLRVDDHPQPIPELARLLELNDFYLTASAEHERLPVDAALRRELDYRTSLLGHPSVAAWVGTENYEMRVAEDISWIDPRVLAILRDITGA
jgi:uncharacterized Ntn-hydrolase superfamily protein